jgi:hypothetical protein
VVSNNESYQIVRHNWAREMPDSKMIREGKYPALLGAPATDYVGLARSQGVDGECVTTVKEPGARAPAGHGGHPRRENRPYMVEVAVAREGIGADSTWYQDWRL